MSRLRHVLIAAGIFAAAAVAHGGPLTEAKVTKIINEVSVVDPARGTHRASLDEMIKDEMTLKTGVKSRSELLFNDQTLMRVGAETSFSFKAGTRDMTLGQGTMLLHVPKGLGGAKIRTAAVTAAITGTTIMLEHRPKQSIKVLVLEGSLRLSVNGRFGDSLLLLPGKMVIMPPNAKRVPEPVSVDLKKVMKTSSLVNLGKDKKTAALPSLPLIEEAIEAQQQQKDRNGLIDTNLVIQGEGSNVVLASNDLMTSLDRNAEASPALVSNTRPTVPNPVPAATPAVVPPQPAPQPTAVPSAAPLPSATPLPTASPVASATPPPIDPLPTATPTVDPIPTPTPSIDPSATPTPAASATPVASATPAASATPQPSPTPVIADNDDDDEDSDADYDEVVEIDEQGKGNGVTVDAPIDLSQGGRSGKVKIRGDGAVVMKSTVKVSDSAPENRSTRGGSISVRSEKESGVAISVRSTAELLSLLDAAAPGPGGKITFRAAGGSVHVSGAKIQADRGEIAIENKGDAGDVTVQNATLSANTVKLQVLGKNGQLNIGGGSISADGIIDLYAAGSNGEVRFTDNVTLSGSSVKTIAGHSVTVVNGKTVHVSGSGPASVFTNHPNYSGSGGNGSTTGTFIGAGASTQPFSARPGGG